MNNIGLLPIFIVGLLGSVHCIGMCGGIVGAFSVTPARQPFPVTVIAADCRSPTLAFDTTVRVLSYNTGRIGSYMIAGAMAGSMADGVRTLSGVVSLQIAGYWLANLMLVALGLYLMDAWRGLSKLEALGTVVWRPVQGLLKYLLPADTLLKTIALGSLWGWVPCGMVYSVLLTAMLSGSAVAGAATMLAFGLGTLPMLLAMGLSAARLQASMKRRGVRLAGGMLVLLFGVAGLVRAANGMDIGWLNVFCIASPGVHP